MTAEAAESGGYVQITDPYRRCEEALFMAAISQMRGADFVIVERAIWRHGSELLDCNNSRLKSYREDKPTKHG